MRRPLTASFCSASDQLDGLSWIGHCSTMRNSRQLGENEERQAPPHVHVERDANRAKFWLDPVRLQESGGYRPTELNRVAALVNEHRELLLRRWYEHFSE
jgi:Domain of unknown function (DUF4160)